MLDLVKKDKSVLTIDDIKTRFPNKARTINEETVEIINRANSDPEFNGDEFLATMVTYRGLMDKHQASIQEYINAIRFCAFLEAEDNYTQAYIKARSHEEFVIKRMGLPTDSVGYRELTTAASRHSRSPLVKDILTMSDLPEYLILRSGRYTAANVLLKEMKDALFSKDRIAAAKAYLDAVKPPENVKIELDVGVKQDSIIDKYEAMISGLVSAQMQQIEAGGDLKAIANVAIIKTVNTDEDIIDVE